MYSLFTKDVYICVNCNHIIALKAAGILTLQLCLSAVLLCTVVDVLVPFVVALDFAVQ